MQGPSSWPDSGLQGPGLWRSKGRRVKIGRMAITPHLTGRFYRGVSELEGIMSLSVTSKHALRSPSVGVQAS